MHSFLKWAGSKADAVEMLKSNLPKDVSNLKTYGELFIGKGCLYFELIKADMFEEYIINDINPKLINLYLQIRDNPRKLIENMIILERKYLTSSKSERSDMYYRIRDRFNTSSSREILAAYFIFLNKTCFNGLYRENQYGEFSTSFGKYDTPNFIDESEILELSELLNKKNSKGEFRTKIYNMDYKLLLTLFHENSIVFLDPPYRPITKSKFVNYTSNRFIDKQQLELKEFCTKLDTQGSLFIQTNSDPKEADNEDNFFDELYGNYYIKRTLAKRSINSSTDSNVTEVLITNYPQDMRITKEPKLSFGYRYVSRKTLGKIKKEHIYILSDSNTDKLCMIDLITKETFEVYKSMFLELLKSRALF